MSCILEDVLNNFDKNHLEGRYQALLDDLEDMDYDKEWINAPAAFGDTYRYSTTYTIGDFSFVYEHINAEGEIFSASFTIQNVTENKLFCYQYMKTMESPESNNITIQADLWDNFREAYPLESNNDYYTFINILNFFPLSFGIAIEEVEGKTLMTIKNVEDYIGLYPPE